MDLVVSCDKGDGFISGKSVLVRWEPVPTQEEPGS